MNRAATLETLRGLLDNILQRWPAPVADLRDQARDVVIVASSSRGGSSVFAEILRHSKHLLHFPAEINLFLVLAGLGHPESGTGSDLLEAHHAIPGQQDSRLLSLLGRMLAWDVGQPKPGHLRGKDVERLAHALLLRLSVQWPTCYFDAARLHRWMFDTMAAMVGNKGWIPGSFPDPHTFHTHLLALVSSEHPQVNPYYYDIPPGLIRTCSPAVPRPAGPPSPIIVEEPPFVTVGPWSQASTGSLRNLPLVIKTPSNAYRLPFLKALLPRARFRVLHLTRNAAASINGLFDGWNYCGFHSHYLPGMLRILDYSDRSPRWGRDWWKFDLPPGWEEYAHRPLVEVCAFQWRSSHEAILDFLGREDVDSHRIRFEDVVAHQKTRHEVFRRLCDWLGIPLEDRLSQVVREGLPPIMATGSPRHRRWFEKAHLLEPMLASPQIQETMERLGYAHDPETWT